ncbi:MAG: ATP synthase F0 subunit C [Bdellovibrionaceae bacterium]|jgi:F-type H+-transporting ATPase subunit c|nr:ATP synthase F0 subunit C [Pseudobdellovibrionaceae bacterium]
MKKKILFSIVTLLATVPAFAEGAAASGDGDGMRYMAAAIAIAVAALGGALGQGRIGAAAVEGIARNPQSQKSMFVSMILGLVLIESLVIYALVVALKIAG